MFNLNQSIEGNPRSINVKLPPGSSAESVDVRWPTDAEWCERLKNCRIVHAQSGRNLKRVRDNRPAVSQALFKQICLNGHGETIDEAEAFYVIDRLERADCTGVERMGDLFEIRLKVQGGITVHTLKAPSQKRVLEYKRAISPDPTIHHGNFETRGRLEPSGQLYDDLAQKPAEGYAAGVPIVHKDRVLSALLIEMDAIANDEEGDDFPEE